MKRLPAVSAFALALLLLQPMTAFANMAAPEKPDVGSAITFQRNDALAVTEEVLDIKVTGSTADITATYSMVNVTQEPVSTPVMFLAPNTGDGHVEVTVDGEGVPFSVETYTLTYYKELEAKDWRYAMLNYGAKNTSGEELVSGVSFQLDAEPGQAFAVTVSYPYHLGGYPDYDYNVKRGEILYYLAPAALWQDFQSLTINLYLDEGMPVIKESSVDFRKVDTRVYQYQSDSLPQGNLEITIDESGMQEFFSAFRNPYSLFYLYIFGPPLLLIIAIIVAVNWIRRKRRESKG